VTHPLRKIREIVRDVLGEMTRSLWEALRVKTMWDWGLG
jgi:hypothetical protein